MKTYIFAVKMKTDDFSKLRIAAAKQNKTMSAFVSDLISLAVHKEQLA